MTLDECREHIGDAVVYHPSDMRDGLIGYASRDEDGTIVRVSENWVHVRYGHQTTTKATAPEMLELLAPDPHAGQLWANELQSRQRQVPSDREWS
jgi:hypothetical protein